MTKSYTIRGVDGNDLTVSETIDGQEVVVSIQTNETGAIRTVRLDEEQFAELCGLKYDLHFKPVDPQPLSEAAF